MSIATPPEHRFTRTTLFITGGLLIWLAAFAFLYVFAAVACARGFADVRFLGMGVVPFTTTLASVIAGVVTAWLLRRALRESRSDDEHASFLRFVSYAGSIIALIALIWIALPPLLVGTCAA